MSALRLVSCLATFCLCLPTSAQSEPRQHELLDDSWRFHLNELDGNSAVAPGGNAIMQWVWIADDNAPTDAGTMAAPGLDTSSWTNVTVGTDVFNGRLGYAWFRATLTPLSTPARPLTLHFLNVDDNATVYLNGVLVGQHDGWGQAFDVVVDTGWLNGATNYLAVAVQNTGGPGGIYGGVSLQSGVQLEPAGVPVTQWLWSSDDAAPGDAATMASPGLNTATWSNATVGQDVFNGRTGAAWFRTTLDPLASSGRPLTLHFLSVEDTATVFLNGALLGTHSGAGLPFDISPLDPAWNSNGPNVLAVAVQNNGGAGGILGAVLLQSGSEVPPPGASITQWLWLRDNNATNDAPTMTATNLDTSSWQPAAIGQDVFSNQVGSAWFRASLDSQATSGRPLMLHFLGVADKATVYLNGILLGVHSGANQTFEVGPLDGAWATAGPNILAVAVQNSGGRGGLLEPVLLASGDDIQDISPAGSHFDDSAWRTVHLPHDYIIEGTFNPTADTGHGSLPLETAWYRKTFYLPPSTQGQSVWLDFDGVYHNSTVWLNGQYLGYWHSGYAPFRYDVSQIALPGQTNTLAVHVDPNGFEGWWYEGGGIYRHVWLTVANPLHIAPWGTFVASDVQGPDTNGNASATLTITTTVTNAAVAAQSCLLISQVIAPDGTSPGAITNSILVPGGTATNVVQLLPVPNALLWSLETPQLYVLHSTVQAEGQTIDNYDTTFGIRSLRYDINTGFFLNGKSVKLQGTCNHQDFAGVGIGMPDNLLYWRIKKLKEMGANAYRCSHNPPTAALLDACDRLGMVVMDETRHLGDATGQKSDASTPYSDLSELNAMILRDRNHPSIIMWSMCNEEFGVQSTQHGADLFYAMKERVKQFDTTRPITCAMNGGWGTGISLVEDLQGCNYNPGGYDGFHVAFPSLPMFGSEIGSPNEDRGIYANDSTDGYLSSYTTGAEDAWEPIGVRPFVAGGFIWTGFDYKGEPSPYGWPCINSHFGVLDMCGLPKDSFYYYRAWWDSSPSVYIFPHWNWSTPGQVISVWCFANTDTVELFLNGVSQGVQTVPAFGHVSWSVPYAPGTLSVKGYNSGALAAYYQVTTTGAPATIRLTTDRTALSADGEDLTVVYASVLDSQGFVVPVASNLVTFAAAGAAYVAGVGNGDPSDHEPDRATQRHAFNGWCMALVSATNFSGPIMLTASSPGLTPATLTLQANATNSAPAAPVNLTATASDGQAYLHWDFGFATTSYHIKRATASGGPYSLLANSSAVAYTDSGLTDGTTYFYVVSALNNYGESADSAEVSVTPLPPPPPTTPTGLVAQADDGQVLLSWSASSVAASYDVKRAIARGGPYLVVGNPTAATFTDAGLTNGTVYYYVVSAVSGTQQSVNSSEVSAAPVSMSFLVGTSMGTPGSYNNIGNIREMALDGNLATFFDAPTNLAWVGLDLGPTNARVISKLRYAPRSGFANRMIGGIFQGANLPDFSDGIALYTVTTTPPDGTYTVQFPTNTAAFRYLRYVAPANGYGNIAELEFYSLGPHNNRLSGTLIGTSGSWNNSGNTIQMAMDGDITTFFDGPTANGDWVGLDLGSAQPVTALRFFPRLGYAYRMNGGVFQAANLPDFSVAVNLLSLTSSPPESTFTAQVLTNIGSFRYLRYLSPNASYGDVAEVQFYGPATSSPLTFTPSAPTGLTASAGDAQVQLAWNASSGATNYNIFRGTSSGGPYTLVGACTAVLCMDSGLAPGTYYYVVSAIGPGGTSPNSNEAHATVSCTGLSAFAGLAATAEPGQVHLSWSPIADVSLYEVTRSVNRTGPFVWLATGLRTTTYDDVTAASGSNYFYQVLAENDCGSQTYSPVVAANTFPSPSLQFRSQGTQLLLSWPSWAGAFSIYQAPSLTSPIQWEPLSVTPESSNGMLYLSLPSTNLDQQFFRLAIP
ncbi:MAG TPA: glycoside hydrolase family 2 TIM barrel-domain containing protein [Verrucomicrobiae bacterium]|nr:glycoside hydrolase family 2 TIM barrel-domain containing protein [Verrucomicrobiae bacterium]